MTLPPKTLSKLKEFQLQNGVKTKGNLSVAVTLTRLFQSETRPIDSNSFKTEANGQVRGLGGSALKKILLDHNITKKLSAEGGRTSRGSIGLMEKYVSLINEIAPSESELIEIEKWWIERVQEFFSAKPYKINIDNGRSLKQSIVHLIELAEKRQRENPGTMYVGALYQHLVGAKLRIALKDVEIEVFGYSVSDEQSSRKADFAVGDSAIHVTTSPTEALIDKCKKNIEEGFKPIIITNATGAVTAESLSNNIGIKEQIEIIHIDQFLITNIHEWTFFDSSNRRSSFENLVERYNEIVEEWEGDPSMRIEI